MLPPEQDTRVEGGTREGQDSVTATGRTEKADTKPQHWATGCYSELEAEAYSTCGTAESGSQESKEGSVLQSWERSTKSHKSQKRMLGNHYGKKGHKAELPSDLCAVPHLTWSRSQAGVLGSTVMLSQVPLVSR